MLVDLCGMCQAGAVRNGPRFNFGRKPAQNQPKLKYRLLFPKSYWADVEGPQIYHLTFHLFAVGSKNTKCPRMGLRIGLQGLFGVQLALCFEPRPFPRLPGPAMGPKGAKHLPKTQGRIYHFIVPKVCPVSRTQDFAGR
jgi:hypothetical protein